MSKRRWVEFKICQTISCTAPVSRRQRPAAAAAATGTSAMEDEERQKKLQAGKAKLAEYRQRKAHADGQKKKKKAKKRRETGDNPDGGGTGREDAEPELDKSVEEESESGGGEPDPSTTTEFNFARTLRSGQTVRHDQTYTIEPESEVSTTAEDYSSEVNGCQEMTKMDTCMEFIWDEVDPVPKEVRSGRVQVMEEQLAAKTLVADELSLELDEIRAAFGPDGIQQLQDFEEALKQRDGIITQLTANLQQSRRDKEEVMREFLEMTEQSQKLHIQFQQAGETLRNTSHSSTAQDLLQAKQQLVQYQQLLDEVTSQVKGHQDRAEEQLVQISLLQRRLDEAEMVDRSTGESFAQRLTEKDLLIVEQEGIIEEHERSLTRLREELAHAGRGTEETCARTVNEKDLLISTQTAIITEHERTLNLLKVELAQVERISEETFAQKLNEKALLIAEQERAMSERDSFLHQMKEELTASEKRFSDLNLQMTAKAQELESCKNDLVICKRNLELSQGELDISKVELESSKGEVQNCRVELESNKSELQNCSVELESSKGEVQNCRVELESSKSELQDCKVELESSKSELQNCSVELESSKSELQNCRVELESIKVEFESSKSELQDCKVELESSKSELQNCSVELESNKSELQNCRVELESSKSELQDCKVELESSTSELQNCRVELESSKSELQNCKVELESSKSELQNCRVELESSKSELQNCKVELESSKSELQNCSVELESSKSELQNCSVELESSKSELQNCKVELESSKSELQNCSVELESSKSELQNCRVELESSKGEVQNCRVELESCGGELSVSRQKERMSSNEIQQLMGIVEGLQKQCHQGSLSESETLQRMEEDTVHRLDRLRAELDEMYGEQIVQMKRELRLQHSEVLDQLAKQHRAELDLLRAQTSSRDHSLNEVVEGQIAELQQRLQESQGLHEKVRQELTLVAQEKLRLEGQVKDLLQDLHSTRFKMEQASQNVALHESHRGELQRLQETVDDLKAQLAAAAEVAEEIETKHESETTNYKIKLAMMEREKDAVLDRMAGSQEAELERLRTHLLFSHEEELVVLRENLQRESQLNTENLLNEASVRHGQALEELQNRFKNDREELLNQIAALNDNLKKARHSSEAEELMEADKLRQGVEERARMEGEIQTLLRKIELLENQTVEIRKSLENKCTELEYENNILIETKSAMKEEVESKSEKIASLIVENERMHRQGEELPEQFEMRKSTLSFAETSSEVIFEEYTCLVEVKAQLEDRILKDTRAYESKLADLQSQIQELTENKETCAKMEDKSVDTCGGLMEKDTTEPMKKLETALLEQEGLTVRLSEVTDQLTVTKGELDELEGELRQVRSENKAVITQNESLEVELERLRETLKERTVEVGDEPARSLVKLPQHGLFSTPEAQHPSRTPAPSAAPSLVSTVGEGPVGHSSAAKPSASGSDRRKTQQQRRGKKKRQTSAQSKEKGETEEAATADRNGSSGGATAAAAEQDEQARMESQVSSSSQRTTADEEDTTDVFPTRRERDGFGEQGKTVDGMERRIDTLAAQEPQDEDRRAKDHLECQLQLEAQRISLSQIHAAQLELLQEQTEAHVGTHEQGMVCLKQTKDDPKSSKYQNVVQVVLDDCRRIFLSFADVFGEEFLQSLQHTDVKDWKTHSFEKKETKDPSAVLQDAKETYRDLQQVMDRIEQEHSRLVQLQLVLKADGSKMVEMKKAYDELKLGSLHRHLDRSIIDNISNPDPRETPPACSSSHVPMDVQNLMADVQQQQAQMEANHRLEVEHLRSCYQQQAKETEVRYATELSALQQRLLVVNAAEAEFSLSGAGQPQTEEEDTEELKLVGDDAFLTGVDTELYGSAGSMGLTAQLQTLRRALYRKYLQEVASLKEQHRAELARLTEGKEHKEEDGREEVGSQAKQDLELTDGASRSPEEPVPRDQCGQDMRSRERVEEEIAKVIVQMSVEFAQQSERARIAQSARNTTTAVQTEEDNEEGMEEKQPNPLGSLTTGVSLEEIQGRFSEEKERLERELDERTTELCRIKEQLLCGPSGCEKKTGEQEEDTDGHEDVQRSCPDHQVITAERNLLRKANENLRKVLSEVLKTTAAAEETIGFHVEGLRGSPSPPQIHTRGQGTDSRPARDASPAESCHGSETEADDGSAWSGETEADKGLETSQLGAEDSHSLLPGAELQMENEEYLMNISARLQAAVEKLLVAITETTNQECHLATGAECDFGLPDLQRRSTVCVYSLDGLFIWDQSLFARDQSTSVGSAPIRDSSVFTQGSVLGCAVATVA
ncbi:hypothetical protein DPEC_G00202890 [Dallia pectoralis]|uniref:Uncharacterized protein n=1 Tax=Dallia pectoralis TaxID=75939 RepID=A0ACC2G9U7_DALPE|nr:hypothetical protein DPEC_G00202890 [Dallia pectoralis]